MAENNQTQNNIDIEELKKQTQEYLNNWKRERADFINYKKEETKRVEEIVKFANEGLLLEIIEVLDKLDVGLKHEPSETLKQLTRDFDKFLESHGINRIKIEDKFDPLVHEAVEVEPGGSVLEEIRAGYTMHDKVIRPVRVRIIKR